MLPCWMLITLFSILGLSFYLWYSNRFFTSWCWSLSPDLLVLTDLLKAVANTLDQYINYRAGRVINTSHCTETLQSTGYYLSFHPSLCERSNSRWRTGGMMWKPLKSEKETGLGRENGMYHAGCKHMFQECGVNVYWWFQKHKKESSKLLSQSFIHWIP